MKKIIYSTYYLLLIMLILSGCNTPKPQFNTPKPQFNPSNKEIKVENYKTYAVPHGGTYASITKEYLKKIRNLVKLTRKNIDYTKTAGVKGLVIKAKCGAEIAIKQCKPGTIRWIERRYQRKLESNKSESFLYDMAAFSTGQAGCTAPLSQKEFHDDYYDDLKNENPEMAKQIELQFQADQKQKQSMQQLINTIQGLKKL